jgi:hypothetical protein
MVSQEMLTNFWIFSQEILTKKWAFWGCLVKKPLQKRFYQKNSPVLFDKLEEFIVQKEGVRMLGKSVCVIKWGEL